jgi:hypothetical protein
MQTHGPLSDALHQVEQLLELAAKARAAAAKLSSPRQSQELLLKAHNLEVTANGLARNLDVRGGVAKSA